MKSAKVSKIMVNKKIGKWKRWGSGKTWENGKTNKGYLNSQIKTRWSGKLWGNEKDFEFFIYVYSQQGCVDIEHDCVGCLSRISLQSGTAVHPTHTAVPESISWTLNTPVWAQVCALRHTTVSECKFFNLKHYPSYHTAM